MSRGHSRGRGGGGEEEESGERWLLTYADMITLLMALFMVLFSISSVNISKYQTLQQSLKAAFSGNILPGGKAIARQGSTQNSSHVPASIELQAIEPVATEGASSQTASAQASSAHMSPTAAASASQAAAAQSEASEFAHIKQQIENYAAAHGIGKSVQARIESRGLVIKLLTDDLLFGSGQATLERRSHSLLIEISSLLNIDEDHPIEVSGNTDNVPIHSAVYPSNWQLSTARASTVVMFLAAHRVSPSRLVAVGYAEQHPLGSNLSAEGRAHNRRVEIVVKRIYGSESEQ